jgi:hypothetical protein
VPAAFQAPGTAAQRQRRREWIATSDWLAKLSSPGSFGLVLSRQLLKSLLGFLYVVERKLAGFNQVRHHWFSPAAEESQQFVYQPALRFAARDGRLKYVGVADPLDAAHRFLRFQTIHGGLHRGVGRPAGFWKCFLNLADGTGAAAPQRLHDLKFQLG